MTPGCDRGPRADEDARGPLLHVIESEPADGAGLDCDPEADDCGVPTDTAVTLRFDRFLLPESAVRQSVAVYTGVPSNTALPGNNTRAELSPRYDLSARSVSYVFPAGFMLQPKTLYTVELPIYSDAAPFGFRAFDGAPLEGSESIRFAFFTGKGPAGAPPPPAPPSCDAVKALFDANCTSCHGALGADPAPRMGLALAGWDSICATAIGKVAHQTEIGDTTGVTNQAPARFGVNMPVIDPERPENSYVMYKLLLHDGAYLPDPGDADDCSDPDACVPPDPAELERLQSWFLRGAAMPDSSPSGIHHAELSLIQTFIDSGAACP